jgi:hypothetical protein
MEGSELHTAFVRIIEKQRPLETSGLSRVIILKLLLQKLGMCGLDICDTGQGSGELL